MSLTPVSERSGLALQIISKLEIGTTANPTIETLSRYATTLDARLTLRLEEIEREQ